MVTVTVSMVREIRSLYAAGVPMNKIAVMVGVSPRTIDRYKTQESEEIYRNLERKRHAVNRLKPEVMAKKREAALNRYYRLKEQRQ